MSTYQNTVDRLDVVVTTGVTQPSLYDTITFDNANIAFPTGSTVVFFMRPLLSRIPIINGAAAVALNPVAVDGQNVRYDWQTSDVAIEGEYMGWWGYTLPASALIETPEFRIIITDHGPGYGAATGVVVDGISGYMPVTVNALRRHPNFGDRFLQSHVDFIKRTVLGTAVAPDLESLYDPMLVEFLAKRTALRLITPAKDYWARQHRAVQTEGPGENASYPDMLKALDDLYQRLCRELPQDWRQLQRLVPGLLQLHVEPMPMSSLGDARNPRTGPVTPDPQATRPARLGGPHWNVFMP